MNGLFDMTHIKAERNGRMLTLTLDHPPVNAVNGAMHAELAQVFRLADADPDSDVVVLTGAGKAFCGGGDLQEMDECVRTGEMKFDRVDAKQIIFSMLDMEKPLIARINGHAHGLGATLALFCDVSFMSLKATIADPHVKAGVVAGDGGAVIWPQLIGFARAKEYLFTGKAMKADEAERIGLVNHAVEPELLDAAVDAFAQEMVSGPRDAIRWTKVSVNIALKQLAHAMMDASLSYEWHTFKAPDHSEAVAAFLERRKPTFGQDNVRK
jgi:enoyl-CoA hydratase